MASIAQKKFLRHAESGAVGLVWVIVGRLLLRQGIRFVGMLKVGGHGYVRFLCHKNVSARRIVGLTDFADLIFRVNNYDNSIGPCFTRAVP